MINFFRRIRQKLFSEGKFSQYVLYAFGEILLVVFGILIALQINNWNDQRKEQVKSQELLRALEVEFTNNLNQLDTILKYDNLVVESSLEFLKIGPDDARLKDDLYMRTLLQNTSWNWTFDPQNGALRSGISSGEVNLIRNEELENLLFGWFDLVFDARENEQRALNTRLGAQPVIEKHVRNSDYRSTERTEMGPSKFESDYKALVSDPLFEDYISDRYSRMLDAVNELNDVRTQNIRIIEMIKEELAKDN